MPRVVLLLALAPFPSFDPRPAAAEEVGDELRWVMASRASVARDRSRRS